MTLQTAIAEIEAETPGLSDEDMLSAVNARTVTVNSEIPSGKVRSFLAGAGKLAAIVDKANDTADVSGLRDVAIAIVQTLTPGGGIDFNDAANLVMLDTVAAAFGLTEAQKQALIAMGQSQVSEFSGLRLIDIKRARA